MSPMIPKNQCVGRRLYRIRSRNLRLGVYNPETGGFLGIREKFGSRYVFEEYHWENGPPYGTVHPQEDLGVDLPEDIMLREDMPGSWDKSGTREVYFDRPKAEGGRGWLYKDTDEPLPDGEGGYRHENKALYEWLEAKEKEFPPMVTINLDEQTAKAIVDANTAAGDTSFLVTVKPGENQVTERDARMLWFTLQVLCDQQGTPADAQPGSSESYFGCLKDHAPALNLLRQDLRRYAPSIDLMSDRTGLRDPGADH